MYFWYAMKGRNPRLIELRNQFLIKRRFYWYEVQRKRFDDVLTILSEQEVFLDPEYMMLLFRQNRPLLKEIKSHFEGKTPTERQIAEFSFTTDMVKSGYQQLEAFPN